jgi:hypothetical protein
MTRWRAVAKLARGDRVFGLSLDDVLRLRRPTARITILWPDHVYETVLISTPRSPVIHATITPIRLRTFAQKTALGTPSERLFGG